MIRRLLLALSWLAFIAAAIPLLMGAVMLVNRVPDATGGAMVLGLLAAVLGLMGAGLRFVAGARA